LFQILHYLEKEYTRKYKLRSTPADNSALPDTSPAIDDSALPNTSSDIDDDALPLSMYTFGLVIHSR